MLQHQHLQSESDMAALNEGQYISALDEHINILNNLHEMSVFQTSLLEGRILSRQIGLWKM